AVLLNDQLMEQRWLAENEIMQLTQLKKKIFRLQSELISTPADSKNYSDMENDLFNSKRQLVGLEEFIRANNPLYYQNFVNRKFITIKNVQNDLLSKHNAFIEIFSGDSAVYSLIITPTNSYFNKINRGFFDSLTTS